MATTVKLDPPPSRRSSLIVAMAVSMLAVAALPFALAAYQIHLARESLVLQAQQAHLIAARATADRIGGHFVALANLAEGAAQNPLLYEQPQSEAAREVLAGLLVGQTRLLAAATFYRDGERDRLVQLARPEEGASIPLDVLRGLSMHVAPLRLHGDALLGVARETGRPGLRLALLATAEPVSEALDPRELGESAQLFLLDGDAVHPLFGAQSRLPAPLLDAIATPEVDAQAVRGDYAGELSVGAFARLPVGRWSVASLQPAAEAEAAAARMRQGAIIGMTGVALLVLLVSAVAWRWVVRPLRTLLSLQRSVLQTEDASGSGDLADLQTAFAQIQMYQRNREALREVFLGRYKLLSTLGQGAMGSVFLAWDPRLRRHVAIKTIHLDSLDSELQTALARTLENEAVAVANLKHGNIVGVYDLVAAGQFAFVVMEYVEGGNLRSIVSRNGALSSAEVVVIARAVLGALEAAHKAGLLHLDIKPGNVLVPPDGEIKLADFGVAAWRFELPQLVARGGLAGTPGFIAPEFVRRETPTERSDLYSLGILLVECVTGAAQHLPGAKTGDLRRASQRAVQLPERLRRAEPQLCAAIEALCALNPEDRPESAAVALRAFEQLDAGDGHERLAARARELGEDPLLEAGPSTDVTATPPGDTTRPPPAAAPSEASTTRPPPASSASQSAPTLRLDPDATRPPPKP